MKKSILPFLLGGLSVLALGAAFPMVSTTTANAPQQAVGSWAYQMRDTQDIVVMDTRSGEVWRHLTGGWQSMGKPSDAKKEDE